MPQRKTTAKAEPAVFNLDDYRAVGLADTDEREIQMGEDKTLHVTLARLTSREAKKVKSSEKVSLEEAYKSVVPFIVSWDLQAKNLRTGEVMDVPVPSAPRATELMGEGNEWQVLEVLDNATASAIVLWLAEPGRMNLAAALGKRDSKPSESTDGLSSDATTMKR